MKALRQFQIVRSRRSNLLSGKLFFIFRRPFHVPYCSQVIRAIPERGNSRSITAEGHVRVPEVGAAEESSSQFQSWVAASRFIFLSVRLYRNLKAATDVDVRTVNSTCNARCESGFR